MTNNITNELSNSIWITCRCHMNAEKRTRFLEVYFHVVLGFYSLATIVVSLLGSKSEFFEQIVVVTSIMTLCLSLLVFGFKFGETAARHRSCYLSLQYLLNHTSQTSANVGEEYIKVLKHFPNHSTWDYMRTIVNNVFCTQQEAKASDGKCIKLSVWARSKFVVQWLLLKVLTFLFATLPLVLIFGSIAFKQACQYHGD